MPLTRPRSGLPAALVAVLATLAVLLTGCGQNPSTGSQPAPASTPSATPSAAAEVFPRDVQVGTATVHLDAQPTKIVILGPSLTETAFAIGAGPQVKAVDQLSTYPADAPVSDLDAFKPSAEAVAAQDPDLVLVSDSNEDLIAGLGKLEIPVAVLLAPVDLDAALAQFTLVGQLTGNTVAAQKLATDTQATVDQAVASVKSASASPSAGKISYYWELDPTYYSVTSQTFIGSILGQFGLTNIADSSPKAAGGYPQLSAEYIIDADPDVIFLADGGCCQQSADTVGKRAGWDVTRAVKDPDGVVVINDDIASRWGPRIGDLATTVAASLTKITS